MIKSAYSNDAIGVLVSTLCIAHCLLLPLAVSVIPALDVGFLASDATHRILVLLLLAIGMLAFIPGYRSHGKFSVVLLAILGLLSLGFAAFVASELWEDLAETWLTVFASATLIIAHLKNLNYCRICSVCETPSLSAGKSLC
ncbi:MAG: MerC domain-containing protein [Gammaproteobacteria bacterium]